MNMEGYKEDQERGKMPGGRHLTDGEAKKLIEKYGHLGLSQDKEFFIIVRDDGNETRVHKWKFIPHTTDGGKTVRLIPIEEYITEHFLGTASDTKNPND